MAEVELLTCPSCGARATVDVFCAHDAASRAVSAALSVMGEDRAVVMRYLALFRPPKRLMNWDKVARVLGELMEMVAAQAFSRDGVRYEGVRLGMWVEGMSEVLEASTKTLKRPLTSHGYLLTVMVGVVQRAEQAREARARGETPVGYSAAHAPAQLPGRAVVRPVTEAVAPEHRPLNGPGAEPRQAPAPMPDWVREKLAAFGRRQPRADGVESASAAGAAAGDGAARCVMVVLPGQEQARLCEVVSSKVVRGRERLVVRWIDAPEGVENVFTVNREDVR